MELKSNEEKITRALLVSVDIWVNMTHRRHLTNFLNL